MHMGMLPQYLTNTLVLFTEVEMGVLHPITEVKHFKMGTLYPLAEILYKCSFIGDEMGMLPPMAEIKAFSIGAEIGVLHLKAIVYWS